MHFTFGPIHTSAYVSIRTRPEGRVMPRSSKSIDNYVQFQSAPGPRAG